MNNQMFELNFGSVKFFIFFSCFEMLNGMTENALRCQRQFMKVLKNKRCILS